MHVAFSRDDPTRKIYVQDLMRQQRELIVKVILEQKGSLFLCGNSKMGLDVQHLLKEFIGEEEFKNLDKEKRLIKELWG